MVVVMVNEMQNIINILTMSLRHSLPTMEICSFGFCAFQNYSKEDKNMFSYSLKIQFYFLLLIKFVDCFPVENDSQICSGNITLLELRPPLQYVKLGQDLAHLAHFVSPIPLEGGQFSIWQYLNNSGQWQCANILGGLVLLQPSNQCPQECLQMLRPMVKLEGKNVEIRWLLTDQFAEFHTDFIPFDGIPPIFCAKQWGQCGARVPLFSFYSEFKRDQILSIETELGDEDYEREFDGSPLCYIWPFPFLQVLLQNSAQISASNTPQPEPQQFGCEIIEIAERLGHSLLGQPTNSTSPSKNSLLEQSIGKSNEAEEDEEENCCEELATTMNEYWDQRFTDGRNNGKLFRQSTTTMISETEMIKTIVTRRTTTTIMLSNVETIGENAPKIVKAGILGSDCDGNVEKDEFLRFFKSQNWLHNWRWWILIGALTALLFCFCIISTLLCHLLCLQSFFAICHGQRQNSNLN